MGDGVDDSFVDDIEIVGGGVATVRAFVRWRLHEAGDEGDIGIDLVGGWTGELFCMDEIVGGQSGSPVARGIDGAGGEELGRFGPEDQPTSHGGWSTPSSSRRVTSVPQQVEPGDGRRSPEERFEVAEGDEGQDGVAELGVLVPINAPEALGLFVVGVAARVVAFREDVPEVRHGDPHGGGHDGIDHGGDPKSFVGCGCVEVRAQVGTGHGRSDKTGPLRRAPGSIHEREGTGQG